MIAASIYTAQLHASETEGGYGHSYVLAWISFVFTLFLAVTYLVLRKKSEWEEKATRKKNPNQGRVWILLIGD